MIDKLLTSENSTDSYWLSALLKIGTSFPKYALLSPPTRFDHAEDLTMIPGRWRTYSAIIGALMQIQVAAGLRILLVRASQFLTDSQVDNL